MRLLNCVESALERLGGWRFFNNDRRFEQLAQKKVKNAFTYCVTTLSQSPLELIRRASQLMPAMRTIQYHVRHVHGYGCVSKHGHWCFVGWHLKRKKIEHWYKQPARKHHTHPRARAHTHTHARSHARAHTHPVITAGPHLAPRPRTLVSP